MPAPIADRFVDAKLRLLYVDKELSAHEIALEMQDVMRWPKHPSVSTVYRWLEKAGIQRRSLSASTKIVMKGTDVRKCLSEHAIARNRAQRANGKRSWNPLTPENRAKGPAVLKNMQMSELWEMTCRVCLKPFVRKAVKVRYSAKVCKFLVCSKPCAGRIRQYTHNVPHDLLEAIVGDYENGVPKEYRVVRARYKSNRKKVYGAHFRRG